MIRLTEAGLLFGTLSFGLCVMWLTSMMPEGWQSRTTGAAADVYKLPFAAFAASGTSSALASFFDKSELTSFHNMLVTYTCALSAATSLCMLCGQTPFFWDSFGVQWSPLRYILWLHTTPAMVWCLCVISQSSLGRALWVCMMDVVMLLLGMFSQVVEGRLMQSVLGLASTLALVYVERRVGRIYDALCVELGTDLQKRGINLSRAMYHISWSSFPVIYGVAPLPGVSVTAVEAMYELANFCAKAMFASTLMHNGIAAVHERRSLTLSAAEETNTSKHLDDVHLLGRGSVRMRDKDDLNSLLSEVHDLLDATLTGKHGSLSRVIHEVLARAKERASRVSSHLNGMLAPDGMQRQSVKLHMERADVARICREVADSVSPLSRPGVTVRAVTEAVPEVWCDANRVRQAVHNLMHNACRFTKSGVIELRVRPHGGDKSTSADDPAFILISVRDTGAGIPKDLQQDVFKPFKKLHASDAETSNGVGLGLNHVQQVGWFCVEAWTHFHS